MCRHALKPHSLFDVTRCACRHIGAHRSTTRSSPRWALAPGNAPLALRNARLGQTRPGPAPSPGLRVCVPLRASRPCSAPALGVLRKLRHRPDPARRIAASGHRAALEGPPAALTPTALGRYRLPLLAPSIGTCDRAAPARESVGQDRTTRHSGTAQSTPLRRLHGVARSAPQSRFVVHNRSGHGSPAAPVRRALLRQGSAMPGFSPGLVGQRC